MKKIVAVSIIFGTLMGVGVAAHASCVGDFYSQGRAMGWSVAKSARVAIYCCYS